MLNCHCFDKINNNIFQAERYEVEVDETRTSLAVELFGRYLKTEDGEAVTDVVPPDVIDDASKLLEGE